MRRVLILLIALSVVAAACGDDDGSGPPIPSGPGTTLPPTTTAPPVPDPTQPPPTSPPQTSPPGQIVTGELVRADVPHADSTDVTDEQLARLVAGDIEFALDLLRATGAGDNTVLSPFSIAAAMTMAYAGARGVTADEMRAVLHVMLDDDVLHEARNELSLRISDVADPGEGEEREPLHINIANALWGQEGFPFETDFLTTLSSAYDAGMRIVDFIADTEGARTAINDWVAGETNDRITDLLPPGVLTTDTRLVLTNSIWFKANWFEPFEADRTEPGRFTTPSGDVTVDMMHGGGRMAFTRGDGFSAGRLRYFGGASMLVIAPDPGRFEDVLASLDGELLASTLNSLSTHQVTLTMPRFEFETSLSLRQILGALGMQAAFQPFEADFSGISTAAEDLHLQDIVHKAFISVDEEGTEAAAATALVVGVTSAPPPATLTLDNPFIFLIMDDDTNEILFAGTVLDPS